MMNSTNEDHPHTMPELNSIGDHISYSTDTLCYVSAKITVNAGQSITVTATSNKYGSHSFNSSTPEGTGYDFLTQAGSNFTFTDITSSIKNYKDIQIIKQNFGFNLKKKRETVSLDTENDCYYIIVGDKGADTNKNSNKHWYHWWMIPIP